MRAASLRHEVFRVAADLNHGRGPAEDEAVPPLDLERQLGAADIVQ